MNDKFRENIHRYQSEPYAQKYKEEYKGGYGFKNIRLRIIANPLGSLLLDVPCGTGKIGKMLSRYPIKILAGDLSSQMMELALHEYSPDTFIGFLRLDAQDIPLKNKSVDYIVCLRLFQRLPRNVRLNILREFHRVVNRYLIVSYSYDSSFQRIRQSVRGLFDKQKENFFYERIENIQSELKETGFMLRSIKHVLFGISSEIIILCEAK